MPQVASVAAEMRRMGCYEISLGDTIGILPLISSSPWSLNTTWAGVGTPGSTAAMLDAVIKEVSIHLEKKISNMSFAAN